MNHLVRMAAATMLQELYAVVKREVYANDETGTITPEEAVDFAGRMSIDEMFLGQDIYRALRKKYKDDWAHGMVYEAGRVAGIWQERARRKKVLEAQSPEIKIQEVRSA